MSNYLLLSEQQKINNLLKQLEKQLYNLDIETLKKTLKIIITNNKDANIKDILNYYVDLLSMKMNQLLKKKLTQGLQFGIKTNSIEIVSYGGEYHQNNTTYNINEETLFSLDSISKVMTSVITILGTRTHNYNLNTTIHELNNEYNLDTSIESILKFTAWIKTKKRIEHLSKEETISLLKECKENLTEKKKYKNFFEYSDIGYMILRQVIPNFVELLNQLINQNITYKNKENNNITGGKIKEENITQDTKGRDIIFPGHTGLYANITGLLNFFYTLLYTENILTNKEKELLWKQPYPNPILYNQDGTPKIGNNTYRYINKLAGFYKIPQGIKETYDKLLLFDMPNNTTNKSVASAGTSGSWIIGDTLNLNNNIKNYTAAILTNPYSFVEAKEYPNPINPLNNTPLTVNSKGKIIEYSKKLNPYKETIVTYAIILELLTEYIRVTTPQTLPHIKIKKKINII